MTNRGSVRGSVKDGDRSRRAETAVGGSGCAPVSARRGVAGGAPVRAGALLIAGLLAGCGGGPTADSALGQFMRGTTQEPTSLDTTLLRADVPCPKVKLLPDTESIRVTEKRGEFQEPEVKWLARIDDTARECIRSADGIVARVGVAGRALEGPKGGVGTIRLPIRVAVREGEAVTYSKLHVVSVDLSGASQDFAVIDEAVPIENAADAEILIGFDEKGR